MHLTRFGFNSLVLVYLVPLLLIDFVGNTVFTGSESEYFYYKSLLDGCLVAYAIYQLTRPATATRSTAQQRIDDHNDDVVTFDNLGKLEYIYCIFLSAYSAVNWFFLHELNKLSTGITSTATLVWSILSIAVALLAAVQFYHLKSGSIVELKKRIIQ